MNQLIRHIEYLISRNDCVIIPGLGALLAQYCPARIDEATGVINPPCRRFTFNSGVRGNDATLAMSISRESGMPCHRAVDYVNKEIDSMVHQLHSLGSLSLGRAGTLYYNAGDGTCEFEPFADDRLSVATAWLPSLTATKLDARPRAEKTVVIEAPRPLWSRISRIAAVIALLIGVWFVASTPVSVDNGAVLPASLAPDITRATSTPAILGATQKAKAAEDLDEIPVKEDIQSETAADTPISSSAPAANESDKVMDMDKGRYYIIVGASVSAKEAQKFIDMHPDLQDEASIMRYGKKHVISVSVLDTQEDANSACLKARKTYPDAWIVTN